VYFDELLSSIGRDTWRTPSAMDGERTFEIASPANARQRRARDLVGLIQPSTDREPRKSPRHVEITGKRRSASWRTSA
jgi:hypothetical protein